MATINEYRKAIRDAWLPVVGRKKLSSHEYVYTAELYAARWPVQWVLEAIKRVVGRRRAVHSLGVIKADLEAIKRERKALAVGVEHTRESRDKADRANGIWDREAFSEFLEEVALGTNDPECAAMARELMGQLAGLTHEQALARFGPIASCIDRARR